MLNTLPRKGTLNIELAEFYRGLLRIGQIKFSGHKVDV